ncbi:MAG: nitroreductase family protein [Desulfomonilaceae bacterium]
MQYFSQPVTDLIQQRFSCRKYSRDPIPNGLQLALRERMDLLRGNPHDPEMRFGLLAADGQDGKALRGLGTYGFIQDASGFVVGALKAGKQDLEAYGYRLEQIVLAATDLGLGTCWLGGTFNKSAFARKIALQAGERIPAILAIGLMDDETQARQGVIRQRVNGHKRIPWEELFFDGDWCLPLAREHAGIYATALEMVRVAPSASNKQPWRIVQMESAFHFYLQRTPGYRSLMTRLVRIDDMQRLDMGITMCHFELTARELGLPGQWGSLDHGVVLPDDQIEYVTSWHLTN